MSTDTVAEIQRSGNVAAGTYATSQDALKELFAAFNDWSGQLSSTSLQMCYGLIAANWLIYGSVKGILDSGWAILSLFTVLVALAVNLISSYGFAEYMRSRFAYAEKDRERWEAEFQREKNQPGKWPYSAAMETVGIVTRILKLLLPLIGGVFLIGGCVFR